MPPMTLRRRTWRLLLVVSLTLALVPAVASAPAGAQATTAFDYLKIEGLSQPQYDYDTQVIRETLKLVMEDGEGVYLEITRPKADLKYPVILEASPYHGTLADREGTRILPEPRDSAGKSLGLTGYFAPRGYAVVMMDLRGTGRSEGCLDHLGPKDARDLRQIVEWAASQPWSNGRVGMTGHSYVGSTPMVAAAQNPPSLETIVRRRAWPRCTTTSSRPASPTSCSGRDPSRPTSSSR